MVKKNVLKNILNKNSKIIHIYISNILNSKIKKSVNIICQMIRAHWRVNIFLIYFVLIVNSESFLLITKIFNYK